MIPEEMFLMNNVKLLKHFWYSGDHQVTLYEKALFGQLKTTILSSTSSSGGVASGGTVRGMKWGGQFLAWATDSNIRVMDMNTKSVISLIKRDHSLA